MKKLLLDTTYFLPLIGIVIEGVDDKLVQKFLSSQDYSLQFCDVSLFELAAKGAKISQLESKLSSRDVLNGLDTLRFDNRLHSLSWYSNPLILELAFAFRSLHSDFIDCLILATATCSSDIFATFDQELFTKLKENEQIITTMLEINPSFSFWFDDFSKEIILLKSLTR